MSREKVSHFAFLISFVRAFFLVSKLAYLVLDDFKVSIFTNTLHKVVGQTELLDLVRRLDGKNADALVGELAVSSRLDRGHDEVFGGHEGKLFPDVARDDLRIDDKTLGNVLEGGQDNVCCEEGLGDGNTTVRATWRGELKKKG
jgi:hypothetical protein